MSGREQGRADGDGRRACNADHGCRGGRWRYGWGRRRLSGCGFRGRGRGKPGRQRRGAGSSASRRGGRQRGGGGCRRSHGGDSRRGRGPHGDGRGRCRCDGSGGAHGRGDNGMVRREQSDGCRRRREVGGGNGAQRRRADSEGTGGCRDEEQTSHMSYLATASRIIGRGSASCAVYYIAPSERNPLAYSSFPLPCSWHGSGKSAPANGCRADYTSQRPIAI